MARKHLIIALISAACGDRTATVVPDATTPDAHPPFVMTGNVTELDNATPIANAIVCILGHSELCATTDGNGAWKIDVPFLPPPPAVAIGMIFMAERHLGFVGLDYEDVPGLVSWYGGVPLFDDATATTLLATNAGFIYPMPATGFIQARVHGPVGATASLVPSSGNGAVYTRADGTPDPTLAGTQTTDAVVYFGNVAPGKYDLAVTATGVTCHDGPPNSTLVGNWPPTGSGALGLQVAAGAMTREVTAECY